MRFLNNRFKTIFTRSCITLLVAFSTVIFSSDVFAKSETTVFAELSPEVQDTLLPLADRWEQIEPQRQQMLIRLSRDADPDMRQRIKRHANHWKSLPKHERNKVRRAIRKFENLPPHKRKKLRQRWDNMPPEKHRAIDKAFDRYEQLSAERQKEIREKVRSMSPVERREFLNEIKRHRGEAPVAGSKDIAE